MASTTEYPSECECGNPAEKLGICSRCLDLDYGIKPDKNGQVPASRFDVMMELRNSPSTVQTLVQRCNLSERAVVRALLDLEKLGRVYYEIEENGAKLWNLGDPKNNRNSYWD